MLPYGWLIVHVARLDGSSNGRRYGRSAATGGVALAAPTTATGRGAGDHRGQHGARRASRRRRPIAVLTRSTCRFSPAFVERRLAACRPSPWRPSP
ncbi:MAG: hypothetical protein U0470_00445 [Anaerolineae bacterium]